MIGIYPQILQLGAEVVVLSFMPPRQTARFLERYPQPFPVFCDPDRKLYDSLQLGRASAGSFFQPGVIWGYLRLVLRGWWPWKPEKEADLLQLGGDFVLDRQRRVVYAYRSRDATDRPPAAELLRAVEQAGQAEDPAKS